MQHLRSRQLEQPIKEAIAKGKLFLGICLGLQILFESSEEGKEPCLGIIAGKVRRFCLFLRGGGGFYDFAFLGLLGMSGGEGWLGVVFFGVVGAY